jgi:hypothetical protein
MTDKYTRQFLCYIRWVLYLSGILALMKGYDHLSFFFFFFASILLTGEYENYFFLVNRNKGYAYSCIVYYVIILIYVIYKSGRIFDHFSLFLLFLLLPFIPVLVIIEITEFRSK